MMRTTPLLLLLLAAAVTTAQEAVWAPAFRGTALRLLQDEAATSTTYTGRGDLAGGVTATRLEPAAAVEEVEARAGTGAQSPKGYSLVEDAPRCNAQLGEAYCPKPGVCRACLSWAAMINDVNHTAYILMFWSICTHIHTYLQGRARRGWTCTCPTSSAPPRSLPTPRGVYKPPNPPV